MRRAKKAIGLGVLVAVLSAVILLLGRNSVSQVPPGGPPSGQQPPQQQQLTIQDRINMIMDMLSKRPEFTETERNNIKELLELKGKYEQELQEKRRSLAKLIFGGGSEEEVGKALSEYVKLYEEAIKNVGEKEKKLIEGLTTAKKASLAVMRIIYSFSLFPEMRRTGTGRQQ